MRNAKGFTLLEVLAAVLLFTVGFLALSQAFSSGLLATTDLENVGKALSVAQSRMEELRDTAFAAINSSGPTANADFPDFRVQTAVSGTDPKTIRVTVFWDAKGGQASVRLSTLRANY